MFEISSIYSIWWLIPIFALSFYASKLLYNTKSIKEFGKGGRLLLAIFRFLALSLLGILLISPVIKSNENIEEKAIIFFAVDNSKSLVLKGDSQLVSQKYLKIISAVKDAISEDYELKFLTFDKDVEENEIPNFDREMTDLSAVINYVKNRYKYENVGALVLMTDAIYNIGENPEYEIRDLNFPVYSIGIGDTTINSDLSIKKVIYNKTSFLGNDFPVEVSVSAVHPMYDNTLLELKRDGKTIEERKINLKGDRSLIKEKFLLKADKPGFISYELVLKSQEGEINTLNNSKKFYVEVIGDKKKVLITYDNINPDIAAINSTLKNSREYEGELFNINDFYKSIEEYNLIVLHSSVNGNSRSKLILKEARRNNIPVMLILGAETNTLELNGMNLGFNIDTKLSSNHEVAGVYNANFKDFVINGAFEERLAGFPPLIAPYGIYSNFPSVKTIVNQKIGSVDTDYPLICLTDNSGVRNAFINGEGIWRWRIQEYLSQGSHKFFDEFMLKILRYISINKAKNRFVIEWDKEFLHYNDVVINAILYNSSFEFVDDADVKIKIFNNDGEHFDFAFSNMQNIYTLNAGRFDEGVYRFNASVDYGGEHFEQNGEFSVIKKNIEAMNLVANHNLLRKISSITGGGFANVDDANSVIEEIKEKDEIVSKIITNTKYKDLINYKVILIIILILFTVEWFVRKYLGSY